MNIMILNILTNWGLQDIIEMILLLITLGTVLFTRGVNTGKLETMVSDLANDVEHLRRSLETHKTNTEQRFQLERDRNDTAIEKLRVEITNMFEKVTHRIESLQTALIKETTAMKEIVNLLVTLVREKNNK